MAEFLEFEIKEFEGEAASNRNPSKNQCQLCRNFDTRFINGDLTVRPGYKEKYSAIINTDHRSKLSSISYLGFENIYVPDGGGKEISIIIAKATLAGETGIANPTPSSKNILTFFSSHQFGSSWIAKNWDGATDGKYWLNHTILTTVFTGGNTNCLVPLDFSDSAIIARELLNGWTIINISKTPYEVAQIIETADRGSGAISVNITNNNISWSAGEIVILMRNYIPYDYLLEMYNTTSSELNFHKINNDLRLGFGGKANRIGLTIGYRKKAFLINKFNFGSFDSLVENFSTINNLILTPYFPLQEDDSYVINIDTDSNGSNKLVAGKYFFRLILTTDDYNKYLVAENSITIDTDYNLVLNIKLKAGKFNRLGTKVELYVATTSSSSDNFPTLPYFRLKEYVLSANNYSAGQFIIDEEGFISLPSTLETIELHTENNAAYPDVADYNSVIGFMSNKTGTTVNSTALPTPYLGGFAIRAESAPTNNPIKMKFLKTFEANVAYTISMFARKVTAGAEAMTLKLTIGTFTKTVLLSNSYQEINIDLWLNSSTDFIYFEANCLSIDTISFRIDNLSIKRTVVEAYTNLDIPANGPELSAAIGYEATFDLAKSWDQAIVSQGRTMLVGAYFDKKYDTLIFKSIISGAASYMYDVIPAEQYISPQGKDEIIGAEVLQNLDLIVLKKNSAQYFDPDTGFSKGIFFIDGLISRRSLQNFGDKVMWCGENDIYVSDGLNVLPITEKTIREEYRALTTKTNIIGTREEKDNAYRFFTGDIVNKTEFILTKVGFIRRENATAYPISYVTGRDGTVWFMGSDGKIYTDYDVAGDYANDNNTNIPEPTWKSIEVDIERMGEGIKENNFIFIRSMWIDYTRNYDEDDPIIRMKLVVDGIRSYEKDFIPTGARNKYPIRIWPNGISGRRFYIEIKILSTSPLIGGKHLSIHSVGVLWKPTKKAWF